MSDVKLQIQVTADAASAARGMEEVSRSVEQVADAARQATESIQDIAVPEIPDASFTITAETPVDGVHELNEAVQGVEESSDDAGNKLAKAGDKGKTGMEMIADAAKKALGAIRSLISSLGTWVKNMAVSIKESIGNMLTSIASNVISFSKTAAATIVTQGAAQEQFRLKYQTLLGDMAKGNALFAQIQEFSNVTPFQTDDVVKAGQQLLSFGVAAGDVEATLKAVGNAAAGAGTSAAEMAAIYGKAMVKGKVETESLNQMMERGVPIVKALARQMNVTEGAIYRMASQGKIGAADLKAAFFALSEQGGVFAGMMESQAESVGGKWSTLTGKVLQLAGTIGEQLAPAINMALDYMIQLVDSMAPGIQNGTTMANILTYIGEILPAIVDGFMSIYLTLTWIGAVFKMIFNIVMGVVKLIAADFASHLGMLLKTIESLLNAILYVYNKIAGLLNKKEITVKADFGSGKVLEWAKDTAASGGNDIYAKNVDMYADAFYKTFKASEIGDKIHRNVEGAFGKMAEAVKTNIGKMQTRDNVLPTGETSAAIAHSMPEMASGAERSVDSLAKIGLYNFGAAAEDTLDKRRNSLLEAIRDGIQALRGGKGTANMEVSVV